MYQLCRFEQSEKSYRIEKKIFLDFFLVEMKIFLTRYLPFGARPLLSYCLAGDWR